MAIEMAAGLVAIGAGIAIGFAGLGSGIGQGIAASANRDGQELRTVLPAASLAASAELAQGSAEHEVFLKAAAKSVQAVLTDRADSATGDAKAVLEATTTGDVRLRGGRPARPRCRRGHHARGHAGRARREMGIDRGDQDPDR